MAFIDNGYLFDDNKINEKSTKNQKRLYMSDLAPASYLHTLGSFILKEYKTDISQILAGSDFPLPEDPSGFIHFEHFAGACGLVLKEINDPDLGLKYGNQLSFVNHGPLGAAFMSCKKVADMFDLLIKFINIRFLFRIELIPGPTHTQSTCIIHCASACIPNLVFHAQCIMAGIFKLIDEALGPVNTDITVDFPYPEPENMAKYQEIFPATLNFDKSSLAINFPTSFMEYSLPKHDETSKKMFVNMCENIKQVMEKKKNLAGVIDEMLDAYDTYPSLEQIAQNLNISGRTLRTRLQKENSSFRKVLSGHRIRRSKNMLINTNINIEVIASMLGYSDAANFNRAFKKDMSISPTAFRKQQSQLSE